MNIHLIPIATISNSRKSPTDDHWGEFISEIELASHIPTEAFLGIGTFSHLEIIYYFNKVNMSDIVYAGHPRGNPEYPFVGIFAQRKKDRPNLLGLTTVELISHSDRKITVKYLDAIDGTPVLDIKPDFREFQPKIKTVQPEWVADLMKNYF
jgi:tRNA-Thr(GGU) m(6)t(6)A37 methyltransferase TsaA